jgi:hypothetical protein
MTLSEYVRSWHSRHKQKQTQTTKPLLFAGVFCVFIRLRRKQKQADSLSYNVLAYIDLSERLGDNLHRL